MKKEHTFLSINVKLLTIFAMYPLGKSATYFQKRLFSFSKYFSIVFTYIMAIPVCLSIFINQQDVVQFALNTLNIGIYVSSALSMHFLQKGMETTKKLVEEVNETFKEESDDGATKISAKKTNIFVKQLTLYWYIAITICAQLMAFYPIYSNKTSDRVLAVPTWYPFDWKQSPMYEVLFVIQCLGQFNLTNIYGMADTFIMSVLLLTGKQIELLGCNFENSVYHTLLKHGIPRSSVLRFSKTFNAYGVTDDNGHHKEVVSNYDDYEDEKIYDVIKSYQFVEDLQLTLRRNVKHHQALLKFVHHMENFIWPLMLVKIMASMSYHALICFMLVFSTHQTFLYTIGQYEIMALYELLLISYFGQYLITKGENLRHQVYNAPWYINNYKVQRSFLEVFSGSSRAPHLTVAKMATLSLGTFLAIMKTSTSYFTVLRQTVQR